MNSKTPVGEMDLDRLIQSMEPVLLDDIFVFATVDPSMETDFLSPRMTFIEQEGKTLILTREVALKENLAYEFECRMITLNIHSSLEAVGFLARITQRLAALGMGVNPVSGFYHDHLFVPKDRAQSALDELHKMIAAG